MAVGASTESCPVRAWSVTVVSTGCVRYVGASGRAVRLRLPGGWPRGLAGGCRGRRVSAVVGRIGGMGEPQSATPEAKDRHRQLSEEIEDARWRYFVLDEPLHDDGDT